MRGYIRQRGKKGSWTLEVYLGHDPRTGKKRYKTETVRGTKKQAEKEKRAAELAKRGTFAELFNNLKESPVQKKGKWSKKEKVVAHAVRADDGHIDLVKYLVPVQPKGSWANGKPVARKIEQVEPQITSTFGNDLYFGAWTDLDEDKEYEELDQQFAQTEDPWYEEGDDVYAQYDREAYEQEVY